MMSNRRPNYAGPLFGAAIIGVGIGYLIYKKTGNPFYALLAVIGLTVGDFVFILLTNKYFHKE